MRLIIFLIVILLGTSCTTPKKKLRLERLAYRNLPNTLNLKVGFTQEQVQTILLEPSEVSASKAETVWKYDLYRIPQINSDIVPFKIIFIDDKVSAFGVDQEQIERNKAHVLIQKD